MPRFPLPIEQLLGAFKKLPGVGPKTALRYMYATLRWTKEERAHLANVLVDLNRTLQECKLCRTLSEENPCNICADPKRDAGLLCVVAEPQDLLALESTGSYRGKYYVLGAVISPLDGVRPEDLPVQELLARVSRDAIREVLLAFDGDAEGETTTLYLTKLLKSGTVSVTRLGRGLPLGGDLEYADSVTLTDALTGRRTL